MAQDGPKMAAQDRPKIAQDGPKIAQDGLQDGPRRHQDGPRWSQDGPKMHQNGPKISKVVPNGPRCLQAFLFLSSGDSVKLLAFKDAYKGHEHLL